MLSPLKSAQKPATWADIWWEGGGDASVSCISSATSYDLLNFCRLACWHTALDTFWMFKAGWGYDCEQNGREKAPSCSWTVLPPTGVLNPHKAEGDRTSSSIYATSLLVICKHNCCIALSRQWLLKKCKKKIIKKIQLNIRCWFAYWISSYWVIYRIRVHNMTAFEQKPTQKKQKKKQEHYLTQYKNTNSSAVWDAAGELNLCAQTVSNKEKSLCKECWTLRIHWHQNPLPLSLYSIIYSEGGKEGRGALRLS